MPPTTAQQGVDHRATFASFGMPNEQPIFLSKCAGPNRILNEVVIYFQTTVVHEPGQCFPPFSRRSQLPAPTTLAEVNVFLRTNSIAGASPLQNRTALPYAHSATPSFGPAFCSRSFFSTA